MPHLTLQRRFFLALAALLVALLVVFAGLTRLGLQRSLGAYVAEIELDRLDWLVDTLEERYSRDGDTWAVLANSEPLWRRLLWPGHHGDENKPLLPLFPPQDMATPMAPRLPSPGEGLQPSPVHLPFPGGFGRRGGSPEDGPRMPWLAGMPPPPAHLTSRLSLLDAQGRRLIGAEFDAQAIRRPLTHKGVTVGYLALAPLPDARGEADRAFLAQQSWFIAIAGAAGLVLALLISWTLGRRWLAPITALNGAAQAVAQGHLDTRVPVQGNDELGALARSFNSMAGQLASIEASRRRWLADVAHELRTPLAAMRAEIEALQDGVRPLDPQATARLHRQVMRLGQLVEDLRASMDVPEGPAMDKRLVQPLELLADAGDAMAERFAQAGIGLDTPALHALARNLPARMRGDAGRLYQVLLNLLENTLRYTHAPGRLAASAALLPGHAAGALQSGTTLVITLDDTPPAPAAPDLPHLFDRLYRGESSRSRAHGGSGLGLAICRALMDAHGGTISAALSPLGGLRITLSLPCEEEDSR
ncbi:HAMP domain-containing protein [Xylophilus sp.]|uniref:HAMP domain-containing protein n=1 Tax=Xylophilus sp. TaxID=2653893 RepID=UPI0013BD6ECC|nr:HAMP domain-containing protein [Xylophilus sp.]KAF1043345.1 MAG: Signal transduction histidine-protein kinase BaeS [Xylophilus sp.]